MCHAFETHSSEANFKFSCWFCSQTFNVYSSMVSHLLRKHRGEMDREESNKPIVEQIRDDSESMIHYYMHIDDDGDDDVSQSWVSESSHYRLCRAAALFLLTLKEKHKLTQPAINFSVFQVQQMLTYALDNMKGTIQQCAFRTFGAELPDLNDFTIDPFEELLTEHMQTKFFKDHFDLTVWSCREWALK